MKIGKINTAHQVAIVAEIGNNHEGDMAVARELVYAAAQAGAHAVKFQAIEPRLLVRRTERERIAQLERFQLSTEQFHELFELSRKLSLGFLCTPFYCEAISWLTPLVDAFKIASADNNISGFLKDVAATKKPVLLSTGMSDMTILTAAKETLLGAGATEIMYLHCVSDYPTEFDQASLASIPFFAERFNLPIGYSDHTLGIEACIVAVALGARLIEKHFTLDHNFSSFRDHQLSAEPDELAHLVNRVEETQRMIGTPRNGILSNEKAVAGNARRSLVAAKDIPSGTIITRDMLTAKRPGDGIKPQDIDLLVGRCTNVDIAYDEIITWKMT